ncbi:MAG: hypothetical protein LBB86_10400 [Oscillospiraceae bacterium]|jgi:hypothetical protein|nr:hypothetical protein [Oscillospiraceae bacterium]
MFRLMPGAKLYLGGVTGIILDGNRISAPVDSGPIIEMFDDSSVVSVGASVTLRNNINYVSNGGAIRAVSGSIVVGGTGATIQNNKADNGGGLSNVSGSIAINAGATISNNAADYNGGGIFTPRANLGNLTVASGTTFNGNSAGTGGVPIYAVTDAGLYASHIFGTTWTTPYVQGYNNFDIGYRGPLPNNNPMAVRERLLRARNKGDNSVVWCSNTTDYCKCLNSGN